MPVDLDLPAAHFVPQTGAMCLLKSIVAADDESLTATTVLDHSSLFFRDGRIGSWVSLECMAQAVAAWAGYQSRASGQPPRVGFLLGSRRFQCVKPWLPVGRILRFEVKKEIQLADGLGQFSGCTFDGDELLATATITVFSPEDPMTAVQRRTDG